MSKLKAVHYINQFYAGLGGEEQAHIGLQTIDEKKGPTIGLEANWSGNMEVSKIIMCGDNYINIDENFENIKNDILDIVRKENPDVFIAGPAFNAGRYGVACAKVCDLVKKELNIPVVTSLWHENPAINIYVQDIYILPSTETAAGMKKTIKSLADFSLKLAQKEKIGSAKKEGYIKTGHRYNEYNDEIGAKRVVDILLKKLNGEPYETEVPLRAFDMVPPSKPVDTLKDKKIALITTGGLVPMGNPDKLKQAFSVTYGSYDMTGLTELKEGAYESIHGGYDTTFASADPHRLIPLDEMLVLKNEGEYKELYPNFLTTCGIGTNVESSVDMGSRMAKELLENNVDVALITTTWGTCTRCGATISKELDRAGIPNAVITAFTSIAFNVGANRIVFGGDFTAPTGDPTLPLDREKVFRKRILEKAFMALKDDIQEPTIYTVDEGKES